MLITDPTKGGKTIRVPKWVRFPMFALVVAMFLGGLHTYSYIEGLKSEVAYQKALVQENAYEVLTSEQAIDELEATEEERTDQLVDLAQLTKKMQTKLSELETYKEVIDEKLGSTDKTTDTLPDSFAIEATGSSTSGSISEINEMNPRQSAPMPFEEDNITTDVDVFEDEVDRLLDELSEAIEETEEEVVSYSVRDEQVDEILPYWEAFPSAVPVENTYITSPYGYRSNPLGYGTEFHKGVDFKATYQNVWATGAGKVTYAGYHSGYGYLVVIDHGYGFMTKYAHNSKLLVKAGDTVERYDVIAISGNSGRSSGPHLHYEVHENGEVQDPMDYINQGEE